MGILIGGSCMHKKHKKPYLPNGTERYHLILSLRGPVRVHGLMLGLRTIKSKVTKAFTNLYSLSTLNETHSPSIV